MALPHVLRNYLSKLNITIRSFSRISYRRIPKKYPSFLYILGGTTTLVLAYKLSAIQKVYAAQSKNEEDVKVVKLTSREKRFIRFASVEYDGQLYMTPQDFLESVVEAEPRPRLKRKILNQSELQKIKEGTPSLSKGSPRLFRDLRDKGIISYTEYLFLLSILTKPESGFRIAFNMFDTDGNQRVDKNEFLVVRKLLAGKKCEDNDTVSLKLQTTKMIA